MPAIMGSAQPRTGDAESATKQMKVRKVRVYPDKEQAKKLKKWIGTARWTYNSIVDAALRCAKQKKKLIISKGSLRSNFTNKDALQHNPEKKWVLETPYDIRDEAMNDYIKAVKSNLAAKKPRFEIKFRSKKDTHQSISVLKKHWNRKRGEYAQVFGPRCLKSAEKLPTELECDSRLIRTRLGHWYLCMPLELKVNPGENQARTDLRDVVSLDPGVRTFMTGYDSSGAAWEWGKNDMRRIFRLCKGVDELISTASKEERRGRRYRLYRAAGRIRMKIRNLVDELHKKLARWLCVEFRVVLLPEFKSSSMIKRINRKITSKSARSMATWSHYRFRCRLIDKAREFGTTVIICDEAYTSKTCGWCGHLHDKLGASKNFFCPRCRAHFDRDVNGARNILLRYLTLNVSEAVADGRTAVGSTPLSV